MSAAVAAVLTPGDRVVYGKAAGTVVHVYEGACGFGRCPHERCVEVRDDRWSTTVNWPADKIRPEA